MTEEKLSGQNPRFKRIVVTFAKAVSPAGMTPEQMSWDHKLMVEFMNLVSYGGMARENEKGEPVTWSGEAYDTPEEIQQNLQTWWQQYAPGCVVHYHGIVPLSHCNDSAHKYTIDPA